MKFRQCLFWVHLGAGVTAGLVILMMSVTGVLLTYERQIIAWADRMALADDAKEGERQSLDELLAAVRVHAPDGAITAITVRPDPDAPVAVALGRERLVYVSPQSAQVLGEGLAGPRRFFGFVTRLHRWFAVGDEQRDSAKAITGAANLVFGFIILSGMYLWLPAFWRASQLRMRTLFQRAPRDGKARDWNWHHVFGFWFCLPLFLVMASATVFNYGWANKLVYGVFGEEPPPPRAPPVATSPGPAAAPELPTGLERMFRFAAEQVAGWKSISLQNPDGSADSLTFVIDRGDGGQPQLQTRLVLDSQSGEVLGSESFADLGKGRRARVILRRLHTGEVLGLPGQTLAGLASLAAVLLVWTGLALAWRRLVRPLFARQKRVVSGISPGR